MTGSRWLWFALLLLLAAAGAAYGLRGKSNSLDTVTVTRAEMIRAVYATGTVEPVRWAKLSPEKNGRIAEILRHEGDAVARGDVVARMESRAAEARLREARSNLEFRENEARRKRALLEENAISRREAQDTQRMLGEAAERVEALSREVEDLKLVAPVDGVVLRREVEPGETVQAGEEAFWVGAPRPLRITAEVDEEDIGQVSLGQEALIKADAFPDRVFDGKVSEITPQGDAVNKVFRVRIALPDDTPLMINMTTEVNIVAERIKDALVIPAESESGGFVWRVEGGKARKTAVRIGARGDGRVQIVEGIGEGNALLRVAPAGE